jgi:hypothetical protein
VRQRPLGVPDNVAVRLGISEKQEDLEQQVVDRHDSPCSDALAWDNYADFMSVKFYPTHHEISVDVAFHVSALFCLLAFGRVCS